MINIAAGHICRMKFHASYPGYVKIIIHDSTTPNTSTTVYINSLYGNWKFRKVNIGVQGSFTVPVLPGDVIIDIGSTKYESVSVTISIK